MVGDLLEFDCRQEDRSPPRGVCLTTTTRKEFDKIDPKTQGFFATIIRYWAWAERLECEPQPKKFKRLGEFKSGNPRKPMVNVCEFKKDASRLYGHEMEIAGHASLVLVLAVPNDKSGHRKGRRRQSRSIELAAKRIGELYD